MKLLKKILWLGATLSAAVGFGLAATACDQTPSNTSDSNITDSTGGGDEETMAFVYRVSLQNATGFGFSDATVKLMQGDTVIAQKATNKSGNANFLAEDISTLGVYDVVVENLPKGYVFAEEGKEYKTTATKGTQTVVTISPTGVLQEEAPASLTYELGDIVYDFSVTLCDNTTYKLSDVLKERDLVLLNFWATWCSPCKAEFPVMHDVVQDQKYKDSVSILALSTTDNAAAVSEFKKSNGYTSFHMGSVNRYVSDAQYPYYEKGVLYKGIPHTVMIDRYGVVVFNEVRSMTSISDFSVRFDKFIGEDYVPTVLGTNEEDNGGDEGGGIVQIKPTVTPPAISDLKQTLVESAYADKFTFRFQEEENITPDEEEYDEYNWPWSISENGEYIYASNINVNNSYAILYSTFTATAGDVLTFDYKVGSETNCDIFYVMLDGEIINKYSGNYANEWQTSYSYVFRDYEATEETKEHELAFVFLKDTEKMSFDDKVQMKNLRLLSLEDIADSTQSIDIFRQAASNVNPASETDKTQPRFLNYADVVEPGKGADQSGDSYYHVRNEDGSVGPILYANLMNASAWNETSLWMLAYNNYVVGGGMNFRSALESFAWEATQITSVNGYTPVTKDLQYLLNAAARYTQFGQRYDGKYHDKEWLEICVYWEHYGVAPLPADPMAGITFTAAIPLNANLDGEAGSVTNEVNVPYALNPRGFKYAFTPTRSGAYHVYSKGNSDAIVFLVSGDRKTQLGYFDNKVFADEWKDENGVTQVDGNFEFYWYFEANKTYYLLFTTYLDQAAKYEVCLDYKGATFDYLTNAATGPYSANLNTFELFLPDAIDYAYFDDTDDGVDNGYYYHVKADGTRGGKIYVDVNRATAFIPSNSLYKLCLEALEYEVSKRAFYIEGQEIDGEWVDAHDYTLDLAAICDEAMQQTGELKGFAAVDKNLFEILRIITKSNKYDGIDDTWLLLCYYYKTLDSEAAN